MTHPLAQAAQALVAAADAMAAFVQQQAGPADTNGHVPIEQAGLMVRADEIERPRTKPALYNPFGDNIEDIAAIQQAHPDWRTTIPTTRDVMQATGIVDKLTAVRLRRLLVALADFENSLNDRPGTLSAIKRAWPRWRTEMPSARTLAAFVGATSSSTGQRLLNALRNEY